MRLVKNLLAVLILLLFLCSCRKESFTTNKTALLSTSVDSLHFDTVFTTTGSVSQFIKIINDNNDGIRLSSVRLAGGASSPFKINVDGLPGPETNDVDVLANDSVYVYVTVSINQTTENLPFIVRDSIEITYNGNRSWIQLDAYGRNAHFLRNRKITGSETWDADLPYVILDSLVVGANASLTINKGCNVYMHADAPFIVHGSLNVLGEKSDSTRVVFTGDRLDDPYRDFPASYPGLIFTENSQNSLLRYAEIKNAYQGIVVVGPAQSGTKLKLEQTIIDNAYDIGLVGVNTSIDATNLLVSNCGKNIILALGGRYNFVHSTAATFSNSYIQHKDPVLTVTNFLTQGNVITVNDLNARFRNCIFWGEENGFVKDEVVTARQGATVFNVRFENVLWRMQSTPAGAVSSGIINSADPRFDSINTADRHFNFRLKDDSPAINSGIDVGATIDLDGLPRPVGLPDIGAYEKQ